MANSVLPFPAPAPQRPLVSFAHDPAGSRTRTGRAEQAAECSNHGCGIRVKTVQESASISGFDAHKHVKGRKRHLLVDTLGLLLAVYVTPADLHDSRGARCLRAFLAPLVPRLKKIWADAAYQGQELAQWCLAQGNWDLEVARRPAGTRGFSIQPRRWVVERTFGWLSRNRRLSKDYERKVQTSETLIQVAMIRLLLARVGCKS
jgi:putative transposase